MKVSRDDVRGGIGGTCVVLSAVDCRKVHGCMQTVRCPVRYRVFFETQVLVYCVWHAVVLGYTAQFSVYGRSQDGRRITEGGTPSQILLYSSLPGSFIVFPHVSDFSQEVVWTEDPWESSGIFIRFKFDAWL
jgi:hypothetical protein